ncbi:MAG TPA: hypothetical protein VNT20_18820 [Flavisolibacter sp.]|jgi:hypothetical protein|nr:hypothetical protein [Flavisolibacter sp.]
MKRYLFAAIFISLAAQLHAQFDTLSISKKASASEDSLIALFKRKDWHNYANYMHSSVIEMIGGKEKFVATLHQTMNALESAKFDAFKNGRVLQIIKANNQYQCVIESFMQMTLNGNIISGSSYDLAFSDDGDKWTFLRIDQSLTPETIKLLVPEISGDLKLPKSQFQQGKTLEEFMKTYQLEYLN